MIQVKTLKNDHAMKDKIELNKIIQTLIKFKAIIKVKDKKKYCKFQNFESLAEKLDIFYNSALHMRKN